MEKVHNYDNQHVRSHFNQLKSKKEKLEYLITARGIKAHYYPQYMKNNFEDKYVPQIRNILFSEYDDNILTYDTPEQAIKAGERLMQIWKKELELILDDEASEKAER
jgi:hypothetical protein